MTQASHFSDVFGETLPDGWCETFPVVYPNDPPSGEILDAFHQTGGTRQNARSIDPTQSSYYDLPRYRECLRHLCVDEGSRRFAVDMGSGDGRGVGLLLGLNFASILAIDFDDGALLELWRGLNTKAQASVGLACADVSTRPLIEGQADLVLLLEVMSILGELRPAFQTAADYLRVGGLLVVSDPAPESLLVHALLNRDIENLENIARSGIYKDKVGTRRVALNFRSMTEYEQAACDVGLTLQSRTQFPAHAALLLHALGSKGERERCHELVQHVDAMSTAMLPRINLMIFRKTV